MRGSSFNLQPVLDPDGAHTHNLRVWSDEHPAPTYILPLEHQRGHWREIDVEDPRSVHDHKMGLASGKARSMKQYSPVWEGVLNLDHPTGAGDRQRFGDQVRRFAAGYEKITGHRVLSADVHLDEGRVEDGQPIYNGHAHITVDRTDDRGRPIRLNEAQLRQVQDLAAEITGLIRGEPAAATRRRHLPHQAYRGLAKAGRVRSREDQAREQAATAEAIQEAEKRGVRRGRTQALVSGQGQDLAELYGELRGVLKASGRATQQDYVEARQKREDRAWLEKQIADWTAWCDRQRKAQADDQTAMKKIRQLLPENLHSAPAAVIVPVVATAIAAAADAVRPQAKPAPVPPPPPLPPADPVAVRVTTSEQARDETKTALAASLRRMPDAELTARAAATRQALAEAEAAIRRHGLETATVVRQRSFADGWEVISQVMRSRGLAMPPAQPPRPPEGRGQERE